MKPVKTVFVLLIISVILSVIVYFLNSSDTITNSAADKIGEMAVVAVPIFFFLLFIYIVAKVVGKSVKKVNKKSLPNKNQEGPTAV